MNYDTLFLTHNISVTIFVVIYLVKTVLLLAGKKEGLASVTKITKVPEMIVSVLFLVTGVWMLTQMPEIKTLLIVKIVVVLVAIPIAIVGFKKQNKALGALAFVMIVGVYGLAEMSKKPVNKAAASVDGKEIYSANCASCHGDDGKAGILGAYDLSATTLDKNGMVEVVKNGKERMAPYKGVLTDEQIAAVCDYVMTLKK
jgi:mono/diheme cytochrome c family protein